MLGCEGCILIETGLLNSLGFILFVLIRYAKIDIVIGDTCSHIFCRYLSMVLIIVSNIGFFDHHFSPKACSHYTYVPPVFKGVVPVAYTIWTPDADQSPSLSGNGVASNHGCPVNTHRSVLSSRM
jgi:hypothetical protein